MSKPEVGAGDIEFELDGEKIVLKPSEGACLAICRAPGGLFGPGSVADRVDRADLDTMAMIVRLGLGLGPSSIKDMEAKIYRTGLFKVQTVATRFLVIISNGGQPPAEEAPDAERPQPASA